MTSLRRTSTILLARPGVRRSQRTPRRRTRSCPSATAVSCVAIADVVFLETRMEIGGFSIGHPPYLISKDKGDNSMAEKQEVKRRRRNHRPARPACHGEA